MRGVSRTDVEVAVEEKEGVAEEEVSMVRRSGGNGEPCRILLC